MIPCILSGGVGTRLWPISRKSHPKQFCDLFDESLIVKTVKRLAPLGKPWIITSRDMKVLTERAYSELDLPKDQILYEPCPKNTSAAIALLCQRMSQLGREDEVVGIFPADHFVENTELLLEALKTAELEAKNGKVATLGIAPTYPSTGYGYIELETKNFPTRPQALRALRFCEKPELAVAESYVKSGRFAWNAGIFIFQVKTMLSLIKHHLPEVHSLISRLDADLSNLDQVYAELPSISIDYGIMEKLEELLCIPCAGLGWSDVGSWDEIREMRKGTHSAVQTDCADNYIYSKQADKIYAVAGVSDLTIVDTADALLVVKKGNSQTVKEVQAAVAALRHTSALAHVYEHRPWGEFEVLRDTENFKSKVIRVNPGQKLSYQSHKKRAEHWIIIQGQPQVTLNDVVHSLNPGEHIFIPLGAKHRIYNPTQETVEFVEVQTGTYFGEDDITRYQDDYQRT